MPGSAITGSRIAYYPYRAADVPAEAPLVYFHHRPGFCVLPSERAFDRRFAGLAFDVYLYDRVGTGRSEHLARVEDQAVERDIADLDAIRSELECAR